MKEYVYMHRKTGELLISTEKIEDAELEFLYEVEVRPYGRRGATGTAHTGSTEEEA